MTERALIQFLEANTWTFAKTMPKTPHWYIVKDKCTDSDLFVEAVKLLQKIGIPEKFGKATFKYYVIGEFKYWTNGYPPDMTTIINRFKPEV